MRNMSRPGMSRRIWLGLIGSAVLLSAQTEKDADEAEDWTCLMDPQVHMAAPGKCPLCGMTLVRKAVDREEFPVELTTEPEILRPGADAILTFRVVNPSGEPVQQFAIVHEKLMHLFVIGQDLEFFAHVHPVLQPDGSFRLKMPLPNPGMYRLLADFYPRGAMPQLAVSTLFVTGTGPEPHLVVSTGPQQAANLQARLRMEPTAPSAGLLTRLFYDLNPSEGLEPYLGALAHMLVASEDLVDLIHVHPAAPGKATIQFDVIFPRAGNYRIWTQFQRSSVVNTVVFTIAVKDV